MHEKVERQKDNKSRAVANVAVQSKSNVKQMIGLVDNRQVGTNKEEVNDQQFPQQEYLTIQRNPYGNKMTGCVTACGCLRSIFKQACCEKMNSGHIKTLTDGISKVLSVVSQLPAMPTWPLALAKLLDATIECYDAHKNLKLKEEKAIGGTSEDNKALRLAHNNAIAVNAQVGLAIVGLIAAIVVDVEYSEKEDKETRMALKMCLIALDGVKSAWNNISNNFLTDNRDNYAQIAAPQPAVMM